MEILLSILVGHFFFASENDGRKPVGYLQEVDLPYDNTVVELTNEATGELVYSHRVGVRLLLHLYSLKINTPEDRENRGDMNFKGAVGN